LLIKAVIQDQASLYALESIFSTNLILFSGVRSSKGE